jgi:hypothetical protein
MTFEKVSDTIEDPEEGQIRGHSVDNYVADIQPQSRDGQAGH